MKMKKIAVCMICMLTYTANFSAFALVNPSAWAVDTLESTSWLNTPALAALDATAPITRAEFCTMAVSIYERITGTTAPVSEHAYFLDCYEQSVSAAFELGLVVGRGDNLFAPEEPITRQELCILLHNITIAIGQQNPDQTADFSAFPDGDLVRDYAQTSVGFMLEHQILSGMPTTQDDGTVQNLLAPNNTATREQAFVLASRFADLYADFIPEIEAETTPLPDAVYYDVSTIPQTTADKMTMLFGEGNDRYDDEQTAYENTTVITIPVWTHNSAGETVATTKDLRVHTALAPIVEALFAEIFAGEEQFPIINIGGWAWRSYERSEHRQGTAIDINWEQNMECNIDADGNVIEITTGDLWEPYDNAYSIPADSELVAIFKKYGFSWGGDAWDTKRDYMHFSFMGT